MIIRTSGEQRISGFLAWQGVYSELYFTDKLWPDFTEADLDSALAEFSRRQRRFGA
jgi:undecaprenyl diphosphate synthase